MTAPKRPRRTVERIVDVALALFNEFGEPNVTAAQIAETLGISPGNLYYHFRNKDQIVDRVVDRYAADFGRILVTPGDEADVEDIWLHLHLVFEVIWRYRFIYRDLNDLMARSRRLRARFRAIAEQQRQAALQVFSGLVASGEMIASEAERQALATNIILIASYWLSYEHAIGAVRDTPQIGRAAYQVMAAIAPFLVGDSRRLLETLGADYL